MPTARQGGSAPTTGLQRAACADLASTLPNPAPPNVQRARWAAIASGKLASARRARPEVMVPRKAASRVCRVRVVDIPLHPRLPPVPCAWQAPMLRMLLQCVRRAPWAITAAMDLRSAQWM